MSTDGVVVELHDHRRAAGELDALRHALGADRDEAGEDDDPRQRDRVPSPPQEVVIGIGEDMHWLLVSRSTASRPAADGAAATSASSNSVFDTKVEVNRFEASPMIRVYGEPANRSGSELDQEQRRDERRDVRVEQREEHAAEAGVDRPRARRAAPRAPP